MRAYLSLRRYVDDDFLSWFKQDDAGTVEKLKPVWTQQTVSSSVTATTVSMGQSANRSIKLCKSSVTGVQSDIEILLSWLLLDLLHWSEIIIVVVVVELSEIVVIVVEVIVIVELPEISSLSKGYSHKDCEAQNDSKTELHFSVFLKKLKNLVIFFTNQGCEGHLNSTLAEKWIVHLLHWN